MSVYVQPANHSKTPNVARGKKLLPNPALQDTVVTIKLRTT